MEGSGAHLHVIRLEKNATLLGPVLLEAQDQSLETGLIGHGDPWMMLVREGGGKNDPPPTRTGSPSVAGRRVVAQ
ncbi:hypothetical protein ROR02_25250 [Pararhodospirillum oryzae]|uniref:Uncharacterized protein n=1 Tax=Pararhodospirillum oryzae TaxID=478448 RepID=A0A512HAB5_9PROT|nr:hypothetical protein ROR02_25250 [Pararhodospirillum oryzae]